MCFELVLEKELEVLLYINVQGHGTPALDAMIESSTPYKATAHKKILRQSILVLYARTAVDQAASEPSLITLRIPDNKAPISRGKLKVSSSQGLQIRIGRIASLDQSIGFSAKCLRIWGLTEQDYRENRGTQKPMT